MLPIEWEGPALMFSSQSENSGITHESTNNNNNNKRTLLPTSAWWEDQYAARPAEAKVVPNEWR